MSTASITAVGSAALDTIETPDNRVEDILGGSVFFIGAIGSLFAPVNIVGVVGDDFNLARIEFLREKGVNLDGLEIAPGETFRWEGRYHEDMHTRNTISTELGVFEGFDPKLPLEAAEAEFLLLANIDPNLQLNVLEQVKNTRLVVFDTMNLWININRDEVEEVMKKVDIVTLNDEELFMLTGEISFLRGARKLLKMGPEYIIVKKGGHGSMLVGRNPNDTFICPAYPLDKTIDPTGAGDTFAGAMIGYLAATGELSSLNIRRAMAYGSAAASFTCEDFGLNRLIALTNDELQERMRQLKEMVEF